MMNAIFRWACEKNHFRLVKLLLPSIADIQNSLIIATRSGSIEVVRILLEHPDILVDTIDTGSSYTPLMIATENGYVDIVRLLLEHPDIDINIRNNRRRSALDIAYFLKRQTIDALLWIRISLIIYLILHYKVIVRTQSEECDICLYEQNEFIKCGTCIHYICIECRVKINKCPFCRSLY
jgi:ankyrin repeat protein